MVAIPFVDALWWVASCERCCPPRSLLIQRRAGSHQLSWARDGILNAGLGIVAISALPRPVPAYPAGAMLGASIAFGLVAGVSFLQSEVDGPARMLAFTAFHISIQLSLGVAALITGMAADPVPEIDVAGLGLIASARVVLAGAGVLVVAGAAAVNVDAVAPVPSGAAHD